MNLLVACVAYPKEDSHLMEFVHVRNMAYKKHGINLKVLNFSTEEDYEKDGIEVISYDNFKKNSDQYRNYILVLHAPNIRNHYRMLKSYGKIFKHKVFFFHGHEIVAINKAYPKDFSYTEKSIIKRAFQDFYDRLKLRLWKNYFTNKDKTSPLVFVSNSLLNDFFQYTNIKEETVEGRIFVINNCVSDIFEEEQYNPSEKKIYDFITIRSNLDSSVYCMDVVEKLIKDNTNKKFLVIGKGEYFNINGKPSNLTLINKTLDTKNLLDYINKSKVALMPTRRDSQGVMACELATFGIPLLTSKIHVAMEMMGDFPNVKFVDDWKKASVLEDIPDFVEEKVEKFYKDKNIDEEIKVFNELEVKS